MYYAFVQEETVGCSPSPGRAFMGVLPNLFHDVSGELFVKDNKTIIIRGFSYDGRGPGKFCNFLSCNALVNNAL